MKKVTEKTTLNSVVEDVKKSGFTNIDVCTRDEGDRMLEINQDPSDLTINYFINDRNGRKSISEKEAKDLIQEQKI